MPRNRSKKANIESITLGELLTSLSIKQAFAVLSLVAVAISTAYGYGYTSAQTIATSNMTLHIIEDKKEQIENMKIRNDKDIEIEKLRMENERLKGDTSYQLATSPPKQPALIISVPKHNER